MRLLKDAQGLVKTHSSLTGAEVSRFGIRAGEWNMSFQDFLPLDRFHTAFYIVACISSIALARRAAETSTNNCLSSIIQFYLPFVTPTEQNPFVLLLREKVVWRSV